MAFGRYAGGRSAKFAGVPVGVQYLFFTKSVSEGGRARYRCDGCQTSARSYRVMTWAGREVDTDWDHCERERAVEEWTQAEDRKRIQWEREQRREEREWTRERLAWVPLSGSAHLSLYTGKVA